MAASPKPFTPKAQEEHKTAQLHMRRFWELRQKLPPARVQGHVLRSGHVIARGRDSSWPSAGWTSVALLLLSKSRSSASQHHLACLGCGTKTLSRLLVLQCRCHTLLDTMHKCFARWSTLRATLRRTIKPNHLQHVNLEVSKPAATIHRSVRRRRRRHTAVATASATTADPSTSTSTSTSSVALALY